MTTTEKIITIAMVVIGTMITRFLPFIIFPENKNPPKTVTYLGKVLPYAVMGVLVIYSLKGAFFSKYHAVPELIAVGVLVLIHKWRKSTLLSIGTATILYMILVQNFFV